MVSLPAILHVENDPDDIFITQRAFKKAGLAVRVSSVLSGQEAMSYLEGKERFSDRNDFPLPSLILLDWNMPLMSGGDFLKWVRSQKSFEQIPVVVLTSSDNPADVRETYDLGGNGFVVKPSNLEKFQALANSCASFWMDWNRTVPV
jgi:CheY-like chemotaxis protein